jgi:thioredoxin:protein disulfide reductase
MSLPKSGAWMESVKSVGGIALVWAALYFLRPVVRDLRMFASPELWFLGLALAAAVAGIVIGGIKLSFHGPWKEKLRKGSGVALIVLGAYGACDWKLTPKQRLPWVHDEAAAFARAEAEGKGVMVDFGAAWCVPCDELELTFADDEVYEAITASFVPLKLDVTEDSAKNDELKGRYHVATLPSVIFLDAKRRVLGRVKKLLEPTPMLRVVRPAAKQIASSTPASATRPATTP